MADPAARPLPEALGPPVRRRPLAGGSIAEVERLDLADGRVAVAKWTPYDARLEAEGLRALAAAGAPVPRVLHVEQGLLVLEHVSGTPDWAALGTSLARVHLADAGPAFGWERDNVIGPLPQHNAPTDAWPAFYGEHRLAPYLGDLPPDLARRLGEAIEDGRLARLLDHDVRPSLVHGDLWSGNVVDGRWLVDPAVHRADREYDLAFAALFGGFPDAFWRAYAEHAPLDEGWRERRPALQLHHLLVHVRLFGGGYLRQVIDRLDVLGW